MEQAKTLFREGVMSHLQEMEKLSRKLAMRQEQNREHGRVMEEKREQILRLRRERDELRSKIKKQKEQILAMKEEESKPAVPSTRSRLQELRLEELQSIMEARWFTGISGRQRDDGVSFCISTSFEGTYLDSYYLLVNDVKTPRIIRHSIPPFIPLGDLAKEYLPANLKKLLSQLFEYLNGYAGRKFQADQLEKSSSSSSSSSAYISGTLEKNSLHTVLSFKYNVETDGEKSCFSARLSYKDVTRILPTEVTVTCSDLEASLQEAASSHESLFYSQALHRVLESMAT